VNRDLCWHSGEKRSNPMNTTPTRLIKIATLHPESVQRYQDLHDALPEANRRHMLEGGYQSLTIHRHGLTLVMILEVDERKALSGRVVDREAEQRWHDLTAPCFAQPWQDLSLVYTLMPQQESP